MILPMTAMMAPASNPRYPANLKSLLAPSIAKPLA
jgi:hypothetical protein